MWAECEKCNKFSHCNNNELVCRTRYNEIWRQSKAYESQLEQIIEKCKTEDKSCPSHNCNNCSGMAICGSNFARQLLILLKIEGAENGQK